MANGPVAQIIELLGTPRGECIRFTCDDGTAIPKGTLLTCSDPRTVSKQTGTANFIGICASEKVANDGQTSIGVYTKGIFSIESGAAITAGDRLQTGVEENKVITTDAAGLLVSTVGTALETAAGDAEAIAVFVGGGY